MSDIDLDAIESRANAAPAGPWKFSGSDQQSQGWVSSHDGTICDLWAPAGAFIAAARTDVPALCALVRRLRTGSMWRCICGSGGNNIADVAHHIATCWVMGMTGGESPS